MNIDKMKNNYHTHTFRCKHAGGTEAEYIEKAISGGIEILGFSDHAPMPFPKDYDPPTRMDFDQIENYVTTILKLKKEYEKDIEIHLGLEVEYYPAYWEQFLRLIEPYPIEYMILGQHFLGNEIGQLWCGKPMDSPEHLKQYVRQTIEGLDQYQFLYLAHPDLIHFTGDPELYRDWMRVLIKECIKRSVLLEINLLGLRTNRNYPNPVFWEIAGQENAKVVIGIDAHQVEQMDYQESERMAKELVDRFQLNLVEDALPLN